MTQPLFCPKHYKFSKSSPEKYLILSVFITLLHTNSFPPLLLFRDSYLTEELPRIFSQSIEIHTRADEVSKVHFKATNCELSESLFISLMVQARGPAAQPRQQRQRPRANAALLTNHNDESDDEARAAWQGRFQAPLKPYVKVAFAEPEPSLGIFHDRVFRDTSLGMRLINAYSRKRRDRTLAVTTLGTASTERKGWNDVDAPIVLGVRGVHSSWSLLTRHSQLGARFSEQEFAKAAIDHYSFLAYSFFEPVDKNDDLPMYVSANKQNRNSSTI